MPFWIELLRTSMAVNGFPKASNTPAKPPSGQAFDEKKWRTLGEYHPKRSFWHSRTIFLSNDEVFPKVTSHQISGSSRLLGAASRHRPGATFPGEHAEHSTEWNLWNRWNPWNWNTQRWNLWNPGHLNPWNPWNLFGADTEVRLRIPRSGSGKFRCRRFRCRC